MYAKNNNKTAMQSRQMLSDALFQLMKRKPFERISVTEICEKAAIGRKTFYRNFELREDLIAFRLDQMVEEYATEIEGLSYEGQLRYHFEYVQRYQDIFITLYKNNLIWMTAQRFTILLPKTMPIWSENAVEQEYRCGYIMAGIEAIQKIWIERGCQESIDTVIAMIKRAQDKQIPLEDQKRPT